MKIIKKATGGTVTLTGDADEGDVRNGKTFYNDSTTKKTGTLVPLDTSDATATASAMLDGETAYVNGAKVTGNIPTNTLDVTLDGSQTSQTIPEGYFAQGTSRVQIQTQTKQITPSNQIQHAEPDADYVLTDVEVAAIPSPYFNVSGVTAAAADVASGKKFVTATGVLTDGTASGAAVQSWDVSASVSDHVVAGLIPIDANPHYLFFVSGTGNMLDYTSANDRPWNNYCSSIEKVYFGAGVTNIGGNAFKAFANALFVYADYSNVASIGNNAFSGCALESFANVNFGNVTTIGFAAFDMCNASTFSSANFAKVSVIGDWAFTSVNAGFTTIILGSLGHSVTSIGSNSFYSVNALASITIYTSGGAPLSGQPWGATAATVTYLSA